MQALPKHPRLIDLHASWKTAARNISFLAALILFLLVLNQFRSDVLLRLFLSYLATVSELIM